MIKVSKFYDKKPVLKDIYLSFFKDGFLVVKLADLDHREDDLVGFVVAHTLKAKT